MSLVRLEIIGDSMPLVSQPIVKYGARNTCKGSRRPFTRPELWSS